MRFLLVLAALYYWSYGGLLEPLQQSREGQETERPAELPNRDALITDLKQTFAETDEKSKKQAAASSLVRYGVEDDKYFEYLANLARQILEKRMPYFISMETDESGKRGYSEEFLEWTQENGLEPEAAAIQAWEDIGTFIHFAYTGDPRAYDLLVAALDSPNPVIVMKAARGLGAIGDNRAIPLILEAARKAPNSLAWSIAEPLLSFDDGMVHQKAREFFPSDELFEELLVKYGHARRNDE